MKHFSVITTELYPAMGLGNHLWTYAVCRTIAMDRGLDFGIQSAYRFKGRHIMKLDYGCKVRGRSSRSFSSRLPDGVEHYYLERLTRMPSSGERIPCFDPYLSRISDGTKIDGYFQAERYIRHRKNEISNWFTVDHDAKATEDLCVVSVRGSDYLTLGLALGAQYYRHAIAAMNRLRPGARFVVITDDPVHARRLLPDLKFAHPPGSRLTVNRLTRRRRFLGEQLALLQQAPMMILANSSYAWWGAWTNAGDPLVIAPKYWRRHNSSDGYWHAGDSLTQDWLWLDRDGALFTADECAREFDGYKTLHGLE